jgi:hypothetical protein
MPGTPQLGVTIDFTNGPAFVVTAFTLDDAIKGLLGTGQLADGDDEIVVTNEVLRASVRRGRNRILNKFEAGTATIEIRDDNGDFNPSNTSGPYYGKLIPLRKVRVFADYDSVRYYLFSGFITSYDTSFARGVDEVSKVTLSCVDGFRLLTGANITTVTGATAGQLSGARVTNLLNLVSWPGAARSIGTGDSTLQADPGTSRTSLDALQTVEASEFGAFYVDAEGKAVFLDRHTISQKADATATIYSDTGVGIAFQSIDFAFDDTLLVNDVTVQRSGGVAQNVSDATSVATYFQHSGIRSDILVETDDEALNMARSILLARKETTLRIDSMGLNLMDASATTRIVAALNAELFDLVNVTKAMPGATTITRELFIQGVQYDITRSTFSATLLTAEPIIQAFILDSLTQGVLDTDVLTY